MGVLSGAAFWRNNSSNSMNQALPPRLARRTFSLPRGGGRRASVGAATATSCCHTDQNSLSLNHQARQTPPRRRLCTGWAPTPPPIISSATCRVKARPTPYSTTPHRTTPHHTTHRLLQYSRSTNNVSHSVPFCSVPSRLLIYFGRGDQKQENGATTATTSPKRANK